MFTVGVAIVGCLLYVLTIPMAWPITMWIGKKRGWDMACYPMLGDDEVWLALICAIWPISYILIGLGIAAVTAVDVLFPALEKLFVTLSHWPDWLARRREGRELPRAIAKDSRES